MPVQLNRDKRTILYDGKETQFTSKEFSIFMYLYDHPNTIHTPEEIYRYVWNSEPYQVKSIIYVHICHIREKLRIDNMLDSVWKKGYRCNRS